MNFQAAALEDVVTPLAFKSVLKLDSVHLIIFFPGISFHFSTPKLMCIKQITMGQ